MEEDKSSESMNILALMHDLNHLVKNRLRQNEGGMKSGYHHVLFHLRNEDGISQYRIVRLTHFKAPTISVMLRDMEADGYVKRVPDEHDMRQINVFLTEKGRAFNSAMDKSFRSVEERLLEGLTDAEIEEFRTIALKMITNLQNKKEENDD